MAVGLMNRMLAGGTLQFYLTRSPMFNTAMTAYFGQINAREAEFRPSGDGLEIARSAASSDSVWHLEVQGDLVEYDAHFAFAAPLNLILRYSNADAGSGDMITVLVNGMPVGAIATVNTGDFDIFTTAPPVPLGPLTGPVTIGLRLDATDGGGVDLDRFRIDFAQPGGEPESEAPEGESEDFASFIPTVVWDASDSVREAKTQQSAPVAAIHVVPRDLSKTVGATMAQDSRDQLDNTNPRRPLEDWSQAVDEYFAGFS
jgi:hypothetical protein